MYVNMYVMHKRIKVEHMYVCMYVFWKLINCDGRKSPFCVNICNAPWVCTLYYNSHCTIVD